MGEIIQTMTTSYSVLAPAIYSNLTGGTALITALGGTAVYSDAAPDGVALPYVVYSYQAGGPENLTPSDLRSCLVYVRAYAASRQAAESIASLIFDRLYHTNLSLTGYTNFFTTCESEVVLIEHNPAGIPTYTAGGMYRIRFDE